MLASKRRGNKSFFEGNSKHRLEKRGEEEKKMRQKKN